LPKYFFAIRWPDAEHADEDALIFPMKPLGVTTPTA
jgi:hypothetical protein